MPVDTLNAGSVLQQLVANLRAVVVGCQVEKGAAPPGDGVHVNPVVEQPLYAFLLVVVHGRLDAVSVDSDDERACSDLLDGEMEPVAVCKYSLPVLLALGQLVPHGTQGLLACGGVSILVFPLQQVHELPCLLVGPFAIL